MTTSAWAAVSLGDPVNQGTGPNCTTSETVLEIDLNFDLSVRNCWNEAVKVLLTLTYNTPGGDIGDADQHGSDEVLAILANHQDESELLIQNVLNDPNNHQTIVTITGRTSSVATGQQLGTEVQVSRAEDPNQQFLSGPEENAIKDQLRRQLRIRGLHTPDSSTGCGTFDIAAMSIENRGPYRLKGSLLGKTLCSTTYNFSNGPDNCRAAAADGISTEAGELMFEFQHLPSESCVEGDSTESTLEFRYHDCCDPMQGITAANQSKVTIQCVQATITEVEIDGVTQPLQTHLQIGYIKDVEPSLPSWSTDPIFDISEADVTLDCNDFDLGPKTIRTANPVSVCKESGDFQDRDDDGYDGCETFLGSTTLPDGGTSVELFRIRRNRDFSDTDPGFQEFNETDIDEIQISQLPDPPVSIPLNGTNFPGIGLLNRLTFVTPSGLVPGEHTLTIVPSAQSGLSPVVVRDKLTVQEPAFVAVPGSNYVSIINEQDGTLMDSDPEDFDASLLTLPAAPSGVAQSRDAATSNSEVYAVSGDSFYRIQIAADSSMTIVDVDVNPTNGLGALIGNDTRELALDSAGHFAFTLHDQGKVGAVQVESGLPTRFTAFGSIASLSGTASRVSVRDIPPNGSNPRFAIFATSSCINCQSVADTCGGTVAMLESPSNPLGSPATAPEYAFAELDNELQTMLPGGYISNGWKTLGGLSRVKFIPDWWLLDISNPGACEFLPDPPPGGGSSENYFRKVWLHARVLEAVVDAQGVVSGWSLDCEADYEISSMLATATAPLWDHVGLDFNANDDRLYVASPESNELVVIDPSTFTEAGPRIPVGSHPFDVDVVNVPTPPIGTNERAYVINHGDALVADSETMSIVDLASGTELSRLVLNQQFGNLPGHVETVRIDHSERLDATAGIIGRYLYIVSANKGNLFRYEVIPNGNTPIARPPLAIGEDLGDTAFKRIILP